MRLMGLMRRPEDLIVSRVLARGPRENYQLPPLLYIDDPRGQWGSLLPHEYFHSLELSSLALVWGTFGAFFLSVAWRSLLPNRSISQVLEVLHLAKAQILRHMGGFRWWFSDPCRPATAGLPGLLLALRTKRWL